MHVGSTLGVVMLKQEHDSGFYIIKGFDGIEGYRCNHEKLGMVEGICFSNVDARTGTV